MPEARHVVPVGGRTLRIWPGVARGCTCTPEEPGAAEQGAAAYNTGREVPEPWPIEQQTDHDLAAYNRSRLKPEPLLRHWFGLLRHGFTGYWLFGVFLLGPWIITLRSWMFRLSSLTWFLLLVATRR